MSTRLRPGLFVAGGAILGLVLFWIACQRPAPPTDTPPEATATARPATADDRKSMMRVPIDQAVVSAEKLGYVCRSGGKAFDSTPRGETTFECKSCQLTIEERGKAWTLTFAARDGIVDQLGASEYDLAIANIATHNMATCSALLQELQAQPPS